MKLDKLLRAEVEKLGHLQINIIIVSSLENAFYLLLTLLGLADHKWMDFAYASIEGPIMLLGALQYPGPHKVVEGSRESWLGPHRLAIQAPIVHGVVEGPMKSQRRAP